MPKYKTTEFNRIRERRIALLKAGIAAVDVARLENITPDALYKSIRKFAKPMVNLRRKNKEENVVPEPLTVSQRLQKYVTKTLQSGGTT